MYSLRQCSTTTSNMCHRLEIGQNMFKGLTISSMITRNKFISSNNVLQEKKYFHKESSFDNLKSVHNKTANCQKYCKLIRKITLDQLWWPTKTCIYLIELFSSYLADLFFRSSKPKGILVLCGYGLIPFQSYSILVLFHQQSYSILVLFHLSLIPS